MVRVTVRVRPGASVTRVGGSHDGALVISVCARAVDGRATEAALEALARALGVRRRQVSLFTGAASRSKLVDVDPGPLPCGQLEARLRDLLDGGAAQG
jgi:uncharacterized protein YggU (UPF0235/DUF167 family)